mmetsp:Transcript_15160/g.23401  ORF Transcript_15160/g.23401 Transcript_15160/m.23401 type:complete len:88 (+) Transcript_15160:1222-1485(+)
MVADLQDVCLAQHKPLQARLKAHKPQLLIFAPALNKKERTLSEMTTHEALQAPHLVKILNPVFVVEGDQLIKTGPYVNVFCQAVVKV